MSQSSPESHDPETSTWFPVSAYAIQYRWIQPQLNCKIDRHLFASATFEYSKSMTTRAMQPDKRTIDSVVLCTSVLAMRWILIKSQSCYLILNIWQPRFENLAVLLGPSNLQRNRVPIETTNETCEVWKSPHPSLFARSTQTQECLSCLTLLSLAILHRLIILLDITLTCGNQLCCRNHPCVIQIDSTCCIA